MKTSKKEKRNKIIEFYEMLGNVLTCPTFLDEVAGQLEKLHKEIRTELSLLDVSVELMRTMHREYHLDPKSEKFDEYNDILEKWAECAFKDMALYMRDIFARLAFERLMNASGTSDECDLFSHISNFRSFGKDGDGGVAVVTVVTNSLRGLKDLLSKADDSFVEVGHCS